MNSDLIIVTFGRQDRALKTRQALEAMRDRQLFGLENSVLVTWDSSGRAAVHQRSEFLAYPRSPRSLLPILFADSIFGDVPEETVRQLVDAGLDAYFLEDVVSALGSSGSALLIYVPHDSFVDTRRLLNALELFRGTVHHTSYPMELEESLLALAWAGA